MPNGERGARLNQPSSRALMYRGRYAPSPTGPLHIGNAFSAYIAWHRAREQHGQFFLRIEDLDTQRTVPGMAEQHMADLRWLGIDWDGEPVVQTQRLPHYAAAIERLVREGRAYYCTCSRKTLQMSAPHGLQDDPPPYPGTCRGRTEKPEGRYSVRFLVRPGMVSFIDGLRGPYSQDVEKTIGDFVIARADGMYAYQLAVVVDDAAMGITEVVRGGDLITSTPRQIQLYEALGVTPPAFAHTPLITAGSEKLSKRSPAHLLRTCGLAPEELRRRFAKFVDSSQATVALAEI